MSLIFLQGLRMQGAVEKRICWNPKALCDAFDCYRSSSSGHQFDEVSCKLHSYFQAIFLSSFDLKPTISMYFKSLVFLDVQLVDLSLTQKALYGYVCTAGVNLAYGLHS